MNKLYIIRGMLLSSIFSIATVNAYAQGMSVQNDTVAIESIIPGRLFNTTKYNNTGAVSTASSESLYKTTTSNFTNTLSGRLPGLFVNTGNGEPGNDNANILIRGIGSYGYGRYNECKFYVDGFEVNLEYLTYLMPSEIESVSVLKDAASLATFGMRGANGVIWIETKRGKIGKPTITVQFRGGLQSPINIHKPLDSYNFASLYNQAVSNDNGMVWSPKYSANDLSAYQNGTGINVDWYDQALRDRVPYIDGDITFNGGSASARYNVIFGYANQQGLYNVSNKSETSNIQMNRYNVRANLDFDLFDFIEARVDIGGRLEQRKRPNYWNLMSDLARYPSNIYPVFDNEEEEHYSGTTLYPNNPVGSIKGLGWYSERLRILQGNFSLKERLDFITKGLYLQEAFSFYSRSTSKYSKTKNYARYYNGETTTTDQTTSIVANKYDPVSMNDWKQAILTLGYGRQFGKHDINSAFNYHLSDFKGDGLFGYKYHYLNFNGRVNYAYDNRYVGEFGFSYFGNDAYAPGNKWGFYPTVSAAWVISNESFLKDNPVVNFLKLRASFGKTGSADTSIAFDNFASNGRYLYQQYYAGSSVGAFYTGTNGVNQKGTLAPLFLANQNAFAEKSLKYNIGADVTLLNKLNVTVDLFLDKRSDILTIDNSLMSYYGVNNFISNVGKMTNKGLEVSASYVDKVGEVGYSLQGMATYAKNKIDYMAEVAPAFAYNGQTGRAYGTPIGLEAVGFYQLSDFNADGSLKKDIPVPAFGNVQPGDIRYKDLDGDGFVDQTDVTAIGKSPYAELTYSFGGSVDYKGFDFSIFFKGSYGADVNMLDYEDHVVAFVNNGNAYDIAKGAWAYYPEQNIDTRATATYPRLTTQNNKNNYQNSSFWMKSNDFLRIQNIELGYDFSKKVLRHSGFSKLRLYVNAVNPVTWSNLLKNYDMDPESMYGYPALKSFNVGITATF